MLRHLSIPSADPFWCKKRRMFTSLSPILGFQLVILAVFGFEGFTSKPVSFLFDLQLSVVAFILGNILSAGLWFTTNNETKVRLDEERRTEGWSEATAKENHRISTHPHN